MEGPDVSCIYHEQNQHDCQLLGLATKPEDHMAPEPKDNETSINGQADFETVVQGMIHEAVRTALVLLLEEEVAFA